MGSMGSKCCIESDVESEEQAAGWKVLVISSNLAPIDPFLRRSYALPHYALQELCSVEGIDKASSRTFMSASCSASVAIALNEST